tara:strand:- start:839 stop:1201 length:363 start_codon:yes stop_codon:yes gene_type:complete
MNKYKIIDDSYIKVGEPYLTIYDHNTNQNVTLHPSIIEAGKMEGRNIHLNIVIDGEFVLLDEKAEDLLKKGFHAIRCSCERCRVSLNQFMSKVKDSGVKVIDSNDMDAVKDTFENLKRRK